MTGPTNGLYTVEVELTEGGRGRATGILVLSDGKIAGGDSYFYYTGSFSHDGDRMRGELTANQHAKIAGALPLFGGREVTCGLTGTYSGDVVEADGTALVGKTSVTFHARLTLRKAL